MAALEYLTSNGLTAYPFKSRKPSSSTTSHPLQDDWFYDILFVSYVDDIRRVYISKLEKTQLGELKITFKNIENFQQIGEITIAAADLVNHHNNPVKSFASASFTSFSVKFVFGPGLVAKPTFQQTYIYSAQERYVETELSSAAVILNTPKVDNINFETYDTDRSREEHTTDDLFLVAAYPSLHDLPIVVSPRHNSIFQLEGTDAGGIYVSSGLGAGLYDPCVVAGGITNVYSVNKIAPNSSGSLFLKTSNCYSANVLSDNEALLFGSYLDPYRAFTIHPTNSTTDTVNVVHIDHGITLQNFCKPKCAPETLGAFAHYLNRVDDAALELSLVAFEVKETRGKGTGSSDIFTAVFCDADTNNPFARCGNNASASYIPCSSGFRKYFHEGRKLQIYVTATEIREYTVLEVISSTSVKVDNSLSGLSNVYFRLLDNGVIGNMNCAVDSYNSQASAYRQPYFKVSHTTTESYNMEGKYGTFLAVSVAIFNPSEETLSLTLIFNPDVIVQQGDFKIRTAETVTLVSTPTVVLGCRDYAAIEAIYYIQCENYGGTLSIGVYDLDNNNAQLGEDYIISNVDGTPCLGSTAGSSYTYNVSQENYSNFNPTISVPNGLSLDATTGEVPSWLTCAFNSTTKLITLDIPNAPTDDVSDVYIFFLTLSVAGDTSKIYRITINYTATPEIVSPLGSSFPSISPLSIYRGATYTSTYPLLQIIATNMSSSNPSREYILTVAGGSLPQGLFFNSASGKLTGQIDAGIQDNTVYSFLIAAQNFGGTSSYQTIAAKVVTADEPSISFSGNNQGPLFNVTNLTTFDDASPLLTLSATNGPIFEYTITGSLPAGLTFLSDTGKVTGKITSNTSGTATVYFAAVNAYGASSLLEATISYTVGQAPQITSPANQQLFSQALTAETTEALPLFTVQALQALGGTNNLDPALPSAYRNRYTAFGLPPGFFITLDEGKVYGKLTDYPQNFTETTYRPIIEVDNGVGKDFVSLGLRIYSAASIRITNVIEGSSFTIIKQKQYTSAAPLFKISASEPVTFTAEGLPTGLSCTASGNIIGVVSKDLKADGYDVILTATAADTRAVSVNCVFLVPISILTPTLDTNYSLSINTNYPQIFTVTCCELDFADSVVITASNLPDGLTFQQGQLSGTPTTLGLKQIRIDAVTSNHGQDFTYVVVNTVPLAYSIGGTVTNGNSPISGARVTLNNGAYTTTQINGTYLLENVQSGSYELTASKNNYYFPTTNSVTVGTSNVTAVNFTGEGPLRMVSGNLYSSSGEPIADGTVYTSTRSTTSKEDGSYVLYVELNTATQIAASSTSHVFSPTGVSVPSGTTDLTNVNFTGTASSLLAAPTNLILTPGNAQISAAFTPPAVPAGSSILGYEYSLSGDNFVYVQGTSQPILIGGLTNGILYSVRLRGVSQLGAGASTDILYTTPLTTPYAPTIVLIVPASQELSVYFAASADYSGAPTTSYEYSTNGGTNYRAASGTTSPLVLTNDSQGNALVNGTQYVVTIRAVNIVGSGIPSNTVNSTPGGAVVTTDAPTNLSYVAGNNSVTVNFTPPNITATITNYRYSLNGGAAYIEFLPASGAVNSLVIAQDHDGNALINGARYSVTISAISTADSGEKTYYADSNSLIVTPSTIASAPLNVTAVSIDTGLIVSFDTPVNNGGYLISSYKYSLNSAAYVSTNSTNNQITITGLTNGQDYTVLVRAVTQAGDGEISAPVTKKPGEPPIIPTIVTPTTAGNQSIAFDYRNPTGFINSSFTKYQYRLNFGVWIDAILITPTAGGDNRIAITGLTNGVSYQVAIRGIFTSGEPTSPSATQNITPYTIPSTPIITSLQQASNTSFNINIAAGTSNGGSSLTGYKYSTNNGTTYSAVTRATNNVLLVSGLTNNVPYQVKIIAVNAAGDSSPSATSNITIRIPPAAPTNVTLTANAVGNNADAVLSFTPALPNDGVISTYQYSIDGGTTWADGLTTTSPLTIAASNFTLGQTYSFKLRAVSDVGFGSVSDANIVKAWGVLTAPTAVVCTQLTPSSFSITFNAPVKTWEAPITTYEYRLSSTASWISTGSADTTINVTGQTLGATLQVQVRAVNSVGPGAMSAAVSFTLVAPPLALPTSTGVITRFLDNPYCINNPNPGIGMHEFDLLVIDFNSIAFGDIDQNLLSVEIAYWPAAEQEPTPLVWNNVLTVGDSTVFTYDSRVYDTCDRNPHNFFAGYCTATAGGLAEDQSNNNISIAEATKIAIGWLYPQPILNFKLRGVNGAGAGPISSTVTTTLEYGS